MFHAVLLPCPLYICFGHKPFASLAAWPRYTWKSTSLDFHTSRTVACIPGICPARHFSFKIFFFSRHCLLKFDLLGLELKTMWQQGHVCLPLGLLIIWRSGGTAHAHNEHFLQPATPKLNLNLLHFFPISHSPLQINGIIILCFFSAFKVFRAIEAPCAWEHVFSTVWTPNRVSPNR